MTTTHCARILTILKAGETLTQLDTMRWEDPCLRIAARIWDLRHGKYDGTHYDIEEVSEPNADGKGRHARYRMKRYTAPASKPYIAFDVPLKAPKMPPARSTPEINAQTRLL